jgi:hypothetical protein
MRRVSNHEDVHGGTSSFETPAFGALLKMRSEVANATRAGLAPSSARSSARQFSDSIVKQP